MSESEIRHGRHCVFQMHVHLVFVTKYRRKVFTKEILADLRDTFDSVCRDFESELVEFDGENDHVHLLVTYPPKVSVAKLVNSLKGVSSRMIRRMGHESIQKQLWKGALWSPSYFAASCGGTLQPVVEVLRYLSLNSTSNNKIHLNSRLKSAFLISSASMPGLYGTGSKEIRDAPDPRSQKQSP